MPVSSTKYENFSLKRNIGNVVNGRQISPKDYPDLLKSLKEYLPKSFMIHFALKLVVDDLMKKKSIWVDSWPDFTCVVITEEKRKEVCTCRANIFCKGPKYAKKLDFLLTSVSKYLSQKLVLIGCIKEVADVLLGRSEANTPILSLPVIWETPTIVYSCEKENLVHVNDPPKIHVESLTSKETEIVCNSWKSRQLYADLKERVDEEIKTLKSICLFNEENKPIAWGLQKQYGCIGMVHVVPEYRNRGLGTLVLSRLGEKILETEDSIHSCVEFGNEASIAVHEKVGFRVNPDFPECVFIHANTKPERLK